MTHICGKNQCVQQLHHQSLVVQYIVASFPMKENRAEILSF